ncbi:MAG TPA: hypothetical protein VFE31_01315 [Opitutaceae bacterium]|jgi:hypothetical protein|nr:hypothetical protein [Opitutaceae bacterium]
MEEKPPKLVTPVSLLVDAILVVVFFIYIFSVVRTHVPSNDPADIKLWGALTAVCLTMLFWLALQMFRVVFRFHREQNRARNSR